MWKGVHPYEYVEKSIRHQYNHYAHVERLCKDFEIKNLGEYHDLYVQSDTLWLAEVFENFWNTWLEVHELDPAKFLPAPGLALKKAEVKLDILTDTNMLLMLKKVLEEHYVTLFINMQKLMIIIKKIIKANNNKIQITTDNNKKW